jgi:hypothetical protein
MCGNRASVDAFKSEVAVCLLVCLGAIQREHRSLDEPAAPPTQSSPKRPVLGELGRVANLGDMRTAKKADIGDRRPHTPGEWAWMERAVRVLIRRMAEYAYDPEATREQLTMADFSSFA